MCLHISAFVKNPLEIMQFVRFSYHSAQAHCRKLASGVMDVAFFGTLTRNGFDAVNAQAIRHCYGAPAVVLRMDEGLLVESDDYIDGSHPVTGDFPAVALVVPASRYERALLLARRSAAAFGVRRPVFLPEQAPLAYLWAAHVARSQPARLPLPQL